MTRFIDKAGRIAEITMIDNRTGCHWEYDFFEVGGLTYNERMNAYEVKDVEYLIDYMKDYMKGQGDFIGEEPGELNNHCWINVSKR